MFTMRLPLIVRHSRNPSNLSTEEMGSAFEQNKEFTKWWEQWVRRLQWGSANARIFTIDGKQNRSLSPRLSRPVRAIAVCRSPSPPSSL